MQRISSAATPVEKFLSPLLLPAVLGLVATGFGLAPAGAAAIAIAAGAGLFWANRGLADAVHIRDDALVVHRRGTQTEIPFIQIRAVQENLWLRPQTLTLHFRQAQPFGMALRFIPAFEPSMLFGSSQVARELRWRAGLATHR